MDFTLIKNDYEQFVERIIKENLWEKEFTLRVIEEYKRFIHLGTIESVAPSREVDVVWHTHLLYTKEYHRMCKELGVEFFHHNPVSKTEKKSDKNEYQKTKQLYIKVFQEQPPLDIWTNWYNTNYINIDLNSHWIIPAGDWKALVKLFIKYLIS